MKPTIALFISDPKCSVQSGNGIIKALGANYNFKLFSKNELEDVFFDNVDMVVVPGGLGDSDSYSNIFKHNDDPVRNFVARGGRYLGICMGAYWAGHHYLNILDNVQVEQYIKQPNTDTKRPHAKSMPVIWNNESMSMFFYDGPTYIGTGNYDTIASYRTGYPMAIIQNKIGLIGCHPESEQFWYDSYSWLRGRYHDGRHSKLLLEFADKLMER